MIAFLPAAFLSSAEAGKSDRQERKVWALASAGRELTGRGRAWGGPWGAPEPRLPPGAVMAEVAAQLLGVKACRFVPRHARALANEFRCYVNYESGLDRED